MHDLVLDGGGGGGGGLCIIHWGSNPDSVQILYLEVLTLKY